MRTFTCAEISPRNLTAPDLRADTAATRRKHAYVITIFIDGARHATAAEAVYLPKEGRLGIAWGAGATWADVADVASGIEMWLNDGAAWEAAN